MEKLNNLILELKETNDQSKINDLCFSIKLIFQENVNNYKLIISDEMIEFLKMGLGDNVNEDVTVTTIKLIQLPLKTQPKETLEFLVKNGIIEILLRDKLTQIGSVSISQAVKELLNKIISLYQYNQFILFSDWFIKQFNQLLNQYSSNDKDKHIVLFRVIDIGMKLLSFNAIESNFNSNERNQQNITYDDQLKSYTDKLFETFKEPFISILIKVLKESDDIIAQMNIIESMEELCKFSKGFQALHESGYFVYLSNLLEKSTNEKYQDELMLATPLLNIVISFISNISNKSQQVTDQLFKEYNYLHCFKYHLKNCDQSGSYVSNKLKYTILSSIGIIGANPKGLDWIIQDQELTKQYAEYLLSGDQETIITIYQSFSIMLKDQQFMKQTSTPMNVILSDKLYQIFNSIPLESFLNKLSKNYQSPIEEIKISSLTLIQALSIHSWGADAICFRMSGFFEYLMNRNNEISKISKEWKFFIVQTLVNLHKDLFFNSNSEWINRYHQMESYLKKGVHFIPYESATKIEDEHM